MFKVGDKGRRINSSFHGMNVGDVGVVEYVSVAGNMIQIAGYIGYHDPKNLELVTEEKPDFQVGDNVVCVLYGDGVVEEVDSSRGFPVYVIFANSETNRYTLGGCHYDQNCNQTLFHSKGYKPPVPGKPNRKPAFEHDEVIMVLTCDGWKARHFKEWSGNMAMCYDRGCSSKTTISFTGFGEYKKYEKNNS